MTKLPKSGIEIDRIVDDVVKDEGTASLLKDKLRESFADPSAKFVRSDATDAGTDEDMWDNLPV